MSADIRDRLQRAAPTSPRPLDLEVLWERGRRRQRRRRTVWSGAATAISAIVVGSVVGTGALSQGRTVTQVAASTPQLAGSANMPDTFVATDFNNEVDLVNSHTGQVKTVLLPSSHQPVDSVAATQTDVYVALYETGGSRIVRVARHGGPPSTISTGDDFFLAVSPNGQSLAWETVAPVPSTSSPTRATPNMVSVEDLASGVTNTWALNSVPNQSRDTYGIWGITWTSNTQIAILSTSYNAVTNASGGCQGTPTDETCTAPPEPAHDAYLTTISTTTPSSSSPASVGFTMPPITQPPGNGSFAAHFFTAGAKPGTYLLAARSTLAQPVTIYQVTETGARVQVEAVQQLSKNQYPTSVDSDHQDILITALDSDTHTTGYIARSTNGANPVNLNATRLWADATW